MKRIFFKGFELRVFPKVYEPSEDSFLLAESVSVPESARVLDLGTGSGIQGINAALQGASGVLSTDVSSDALKNAEENAKRLGLRELFEFRQGSLFECLEGGERFGAIIFNPPYVASGKRRFRDLDGGKRGREVLDSFLRGFAPHLEKGGKCFFLQSSLNGEGETVKALEARGFLHEVLARKKLFFEELLVFAAWRGN